MKPAAVPSKVLRRTLANARASLLDQCGDWGHWRGELSSSALSTATACAALSLASDARIEGPLRAGRAWLAAHRNPDGGFGDTPDSPSNLSTTALVWMALGMPCAGAESEDVPAARAAAAAWIEARVGGLDAARLAAALEEVYGKDRTFAIPILTACAIGGAFSPDDDPWAAVRRLPFELAVLPRRLFKWLGLPVVSYALPALIAIGQAIEHHRPSRNPLTRLARAATRARTLRVLNHIQPENGGFLEATPLTSFVSLSLTSIGEGQHPVARRCLEFLLRSGPARRVLAHRHGPGHLGDVRSGDQRPGRRRTTEPPPPRTSAAGRCPPVCWASSYRSRTPLHPRGAGRLGLDRTFPAACRTRTTRPGPLLALREPGGAPRPSGVGEAARCRGQVAGWTCRTATAASRPSAAAGASCLSTRAART